MAFDPTPTSWLPSWDSDGTTASFDLADLLQPLTAAEADPLTGDWRDIFYSLLDHSWQYHMGLAPGSKPAKLEIEKVVEAVGTDTLKLTYTVVAYVGVDATDIKAES